MSIGFIKYDKYEVQECIRYCPLKYVEIGNFFVRVEKNFCTRTKLFFYVMQIIFFLRTYNYWLCHNAIC